MASVSELIEYYVNLLIIQYNNQPKAQATIALFAQELLANGIFFDIQDAYFIDTSVGVQLDVVGKYQGVNRYFSTLDLSNYFSLIEYSEVDSSPTSPPRWGFSDYSNFDGLSYNGTLVYGDIITKQNALFDDDFRTVIKLKIIENYSNYSHAQIDAAIFNLFGETIRPESTGNMVMAYFISSNVSNIGQAIYSKGLLPKPMGVLAMAVTGVAGKMFCFTDYTDQFTDYGYGFTTYSDYDTLAGQVLVYDQITEF